MFIHDSLSELVVCGETEIAAADVRIVMSQMKRRVAGDNITGFQKQFQVSHSMTVCSIDPRREHGGLAGDTCVCLGLGTRLP